MTPSGEIRIRDFEPNEYRKKDEETEPQKYVEWVLRSVDARFTK
jgi:hypothetical protein